jgi:hypothetical protein
VHSRHAIVHLKSQISDSFEHFPQVRTHPPHFLGLTENLKQLIIRKEVEAGEV